MGKLLRPLHRRRKPRHTRVTVLSGQELADHLGVPLSAVRQTLEARNIRYHKDARGALWATLPIGHQTGKDQTGNRPDR